MPELIPSEKFLEDIEVFCTNQGLKKKIAKALNLLEKNPLYPGLSFHPGGGGISRRGRRTLP